MTTKVRFENRKAMQSFAEASNFLQGEQKKMFTQKIVELFDRKVTSEDGEFSEFTITQNDVDTVLNRMNLSYV